MKKLIAILLCACALLIFCSCEKKEERSVRTVEINEAGELIVIFSDGSTSNVGRVKGDTGEKGEKGEDGVDGVNGKDGINGIDGKDGAAGQKGAVGADGHGGRSIDSVSADKEGNLVIAYSDGKTERVDLLGAVYMFGGYLNEEKTARWALYNGGLLYIYGEGATLDYDEDNVPWAVVRSMITAVLVDNSAGLTLDGELLLGIDPHIVHYVEKTTPAWVDMAVEAPAYATVEDALAPDGKTPVAVLPLGTEMAVVEQNEDYAKILYNGGHAYIAKKYVRPDNGSVVYKSVDIKLNVTGESGATLRYFPDTASDNKYASLSKGAVLTCTGVSMNGNWYRVIYEGEVLYVYGTVVSPMENQ